MFTSNIGYDNIPMRTREGRTTPALKPRKPFPYSKEIQTSSLDCRINCLSLQTLNQNRYAYVT